MSNFSKEDPLIQFITSKILTLTNQRSLKELEPTNLYRKDLLTLDMKKKKNK